MAQITQDDRLLSIATPLGKDVLLLDSFTGTEEISRPFSFDLRLLADIENGMDAKVKPDQLIGKAVTVSLRLPDDSQRYIHGLVHRFVIGPRDEKFAEYRIELVPWLTLLGHASNCRIFQNRSVPEVVEAVFKAAGVSDYSFKLNRSYTTLDYCVQYRETDLNFVQRLLEEEGIFYYFEHGQDKHTLVLADSPSAHQDCPGQSTATFGTALAQGKDLVTDWEERHELFPGKWTLRDYHFELPTNTLEVSEPAVGAASATRNLEMYDSPGDYAQRFNKTGERLGNVKSEGQKLAKLRMEEAESRGTVIEGGSTCRSFVAGFKMTVESLGSQQVKGSYLLTSVQHSASQAPAYLTAAPPGETYANRFTAMPASQSTPFRPARVAPKPVVQGPQSALVVDESKSGNTEEIWPDKYGRVRVRFPWDRDGLSACWVRVAQPRAGKTGGHLWIPRVGDEVLVAFIEGDPDHPVIVGSVYNAQNMPIYELPANKTQNGTKTRSSPKGGSDNFNELRFEDKKGSEMVSFQAEKDLESLVKNDETRTVKHDRTTTVENNETKTIKQGDEKITLEQGSQTVKIFKDQSTTIDTGDCSLVVSQGKLSTNVKMGDMSTEVGMGKLTTKVSMSDIMTEASLGNISTEAKVGNITIKADLGKITIEALQGIELKVGPMSSVKIDMSGITFKGLNVQAEGQVQTSVKGLMCQVNGDTMLMAKGAITMIG